MPVKLLIPFMDNMLFIKGEEFKETGLLLSILVNIFILIVHKKHSYPLSFINLFFVVL